VIWALKDVSFEVKHGEAVGIIGRNGAGKSTLLKILCRITEPTRGRATVYGRVGSLLEVGTGFHPDLTGRENVYLNGTILGMKKREINARFDEIVDFAGVEKFIDTPVKRYSSGMRVRLAFSVAAHLEPEILIVDEVLAVGDAEFQKKCLGKMSQVACAGRTVLFVSHNMHAIRRLCTRVLMLEGGRCILDGGADNVVDQYLNNAGSEKAGGNARNVESECRGKAAYITHWRLQGSTFGAYSVMTRSAFAIVLGVKIVEPVKGAFLGLAIWTDDGTLVWAANSHDGAGTSEDLSPGNYDAVFLVESLRVRPDKYDLEISVNCLTGQLDHWYATPTLDVRHTETTLLPDRWRGLVDARHSFSLVRT
jgi:lipopolysaccharide transport system ATP-binding protein